jgi:Na+-translocating ferredoxin:NAD+ oxidoreductase subunit A
MDNPVLSFEKRKKQLLNLHNIIQIAFASIFINNLILVRMLGLCPFFCATKSVSNSATMGIAVTFVMGIAAAATWLITTFILIPHGIVYLQLIVFMAIIAALVQLTEIAMQKWLPKFNETLGMYLPLITGNCAVLAAALIVAGGDPLTGRPFSFVEACVSGISSGIGFTVALTLMAAIREKLSFTNGWKSLQGLPIAFITAGLMAMAFLGFMGVHFSSFSKGF